MHESHQMQQTLLTPIEHCNPPHQRISPPPPSVCIACVCFALFFFSLFLGSITEPATSVRKSRQCARRLANGRTRGSRGRRGLRFALCGRCPRPGAGRLGRAGPMTGNRCAGAGTNAPAGVASAAPSTTTTARAGAFFGGPSFHALRVRCVLSLILVRVCPILRCVVGSVSQSWVYEGRRENVRGQRPCLRLWAVRGGAVL